MITRLEIENFKSIEKITLDMEPVTVLIGPSGSGKSNITHAVRFLRNTLRANPADAAQKEGGWDKVKPAWESPGTFRMAVEFQLGEDNYRYELGLDWTAHQPIFERFHANKAPVFAWAMAKPQNIHHAAQPTWEHKPNLVVLPNLNRELLLGRISALQDAVDAHAALSTIGVHNFRHDVLAGNMGADVIPEGFLGDMASNYQAIIRGLIVSRQVRAQWDAVHAALRVVNPTLKTVSLDNLQHPKKASVAHSVGAKVLELDLDQESDGFRRFLAHILALYQPQARVLHVFEEPENAIAQGALATLAEEFRNSAEDGRGQVLLTTHSPRLLDVFDAENIRVVRMENFRTLVDPLDAKQKEILAEKLLSPGDLLYVNAAHVKVAPGEDA